MTKIFNKKRKPAFTLAEVLITLTIIGVIAAIVIPNLIQRHLEAEMVVKLKKNVSVLNNAMAQAIRENGSANEWDIGEAGKYVSAEKLMNYLRPYLKIHKDCGKDKGCIADSYKALFNNKSSYSAMSSWGNYYTFTLEDGTAIALHSLGTGCPSNSVCGELWLDLNNRKGPNRMGVDMFRLNVYQNIIRPTHSISYYHKTCATAEGEDKYADGNGINCAAYVLYKGNMDYLRRDVSNEW